MRSESIRTEVARMVRQAPFLPFILNLENGDRIPIGHPENIAFDPGDGTKDGSPYYYVISGQLRHLGTLESVTSVVTIDSVEQLA